MRVLTPARSTHRFHLAVLNGSSKGVDVPLTHDRLIIGRGPGADLVLDVKGPERRHAAVEWDGRGFRVRSLAAGRPLRVNGENARERRLRAGDVIDVGGVRLQLESVEEPLLPVARESGRIAPFTEPDDESPVALCDGLTDHDLRSTLDRHCG